MCLLNRGCRWPECECELINPLTVDALINVSLFHCFFVPKRPPASVLLICDAVAGDLGIDWLPEARIYSHHPIGLGRDGSNRKADQAWGMLADVEEEERRTKMLQRYTELAALPEEERVSQLLMMADVEYDLPKEKLRTFTASRLSVWLMLDPEVARRISASYDDAMRKIPGLQTTRWVAMASQLAKERSNEDQARLAALLPSVFVGLKPASPKKRSQVWRFASQQVHRWWPF